MKTRAGTSGSLIRGILGIGVAFGLFALQAPAAFGANYVPTAARAKMSRDLVDAAENQPATNMVSIIVKTVGPPSALDAARIVALGGQVKRLGYGSMRGYAALLPADKLDDLALGYEVRTVSYDRKISSSLDVARLVADGQGDSCVAAQSTPDPVSSTSSISTSGSGASAMTLASTGLLLWSGHGVTIAVIDSGIAQHEDFQDAAGQNRILGRMSFVGTVVTDDYGHGTHVAGIIAGAGRLSSGPLSYRQFAGVAPAASLISLKVLRETGDGRVSDLLAAMDWVLANRTRYNIRVVNMSIGSPVFESWTTDPLCQAAEKLVASGVNVVVSAGNWGAYGNGSVTSPGISPSVITVGAMNDRNTVGISDDLIGSYSSTGPTWPDHILKPDLVAPGNKIISLRSAGAYLDVNYPTNALPAVDYTTDPAKAGLVGEYFELSGTSMAAPMVSGTVALMLEKDPSLTPATVKARLMKSARKAPLANALVEQPAGEVEVLGRYEGRG